MADLSRRGDLDIKIVDGTDTSTTKAGVTSDNRLKVDAIYSATDFTPWRGKYTNEHLKNGGSADMNVDGSSTAVSFTAGPGSGKKWYISRMIMILEDNSMNSSKFGGITGGLTNGVSFKVTESGTERVLHEHNVKDNAEFYMIAYDVTFVSATTDLLSVRWSFHKSGTFLELKNSTSDNIKIIINDDLTSIDTFHAVIQGYEVDES